MKSDLLEQRAGEIGARAAAQHCEILGATAPPPGVGVECVDGGIRLSGKRLRRRMLDEPILRNFGR
jgi:hypothetical protein